MAIGGRASRSTTPPKQFIIHAMQAASRAHNWQTFSVLEKSKRSTHRLRRGVSGQKTHTDYADDTDLSFHGCFFDSVISLRGDADGF